MIIFSEEVQTRSFLLVPLPFIGRVESWPSSPRRRAPLYLPLLLCRFLGRHLVRSIASGKEKVFFRSIFLLDLEMTRCCDLCPCPFSIWRPSSPLELLTSSINSSSFLYRSVLQLSPSSPSPFLSLLLPFFPFSSDGFVGRPKMPPNLSSLLSVGFDRYRRSGRASRIFKLGQNLPV